ncbi:hypothetical protein UPYG_G00041160 [Umbra pygmaea]|uniref:Cilia- and flagella-associated protein 97 n=1 Tax=Umbra pygmaea TaxID=75934 RepID=A0ABD0Y3M6_UMBPY
MYSPKELEGEVDHSFFDSDAEVDYSKVDKEQGINCERSLTIKETEVKPRDPQTEQNSGTERPSVNTRDPSLLGLIPRPATEEGHGFGAEERSHCPSISSTKSEDDEVVEEVSSILSKDATDIRIASSAEEQEEDTDDDEDGYHQSQDESEEESGRPHGPRLIPGLKGTVHSPPKKPVRKVRHRSRSPSSSSSDSEDSYSSGESCSSGTSPSVDMVPTRSPKRSTKPVLSVPQTSVPSSPRRRPPRLGSASPSKMPQSTTNNMNAMEEEEDTVTDVTPLSTPDSSPAQSLDLGVVREAVVDNEEVEGPEGVGVRHQQPKVTGGCVSARNLSRISPEEEGGSWDPDLEEALLSRLENGLAINCPARGRNRKNYSFSNEEVRHIDRENQRLLRQLSLRSRPHSTGSGSTTSSSLRRSNPPPARLYHSALNRQREQQRIEKENLAFLRRLESVKPTRGMKRAEQLADYQRQAGYLGTATPLSTMDRSPSKMERNSTRMSSGKRARPGSTHHSARASSLTTSTTPLPRHDRADVVRASSS